MQQELIEMLDKMIKHFEYISTDSYYAKETGTILSEAEKLIEKAKNSNAPAQEAGLIARQFDLICQAIDKADTVTMEGDYMLDSDDCIAVVRVMQALFDIAALRAKGGE